MFRHNFPFVGHFPAHKYTDLKLTTLEEEAEGGGRDVPCHKVVMAAVSKKLEVIIDKRGGDDLLVVRNVRFEILQKVVEFVYMGSVEVEEGVDEQDVIDALDMLLIKFEAENEGDLQVVQACHGKSLNFNILEDAINGEDNDENGNRENSRISSLSSVETPVNEFNMLEEDLDLPTGSTDTSQVNIEKSREAFLGSSPGVSLVKTSIPVNYKVVSGSSTTSEDSDAENDMLEGSSGFKEQVMEDGESNEIINHNLPEILSPGAYGSCREPILLKKSPSSHIRNDNRESVSGSAEKNRDRSCGKLLKKRKVELMAEFTRNEQTPEEWKDPAKYLVKCDYCDTKLSYMGYSRHLKTQHATVSKRRIKCEICYKEVREVILKHHMAVLHRNSKVTYKEETFAKK